MKTEEPTIKQIEYIKFIERETGIIFKGKTKQKASIFIDKNKIKIPFDAYQNDWSISNGY